MRTPDESPLEGSAAGSVQMSEKALQKAALELAERMGFRWAHFRTARTNRGDFLTPQSGHPGFPDAVLVRPPRLLFAEFKSTTGRLSPEQTLWLDALRRSGVEVYVWKPAHWISGEIEQILR